MSSSNLLLFLQIGNLWAKWVRKHACVSDYEWAFNLSESKFNQLKVVDFSVISFGTFKLYLCAWNRLLFISIALEAEPFCYIKQVQSKYLYSWNFITFLSINSFAQQIVNFENWIRQISTLYWIVRCTVGAKFHYNRFASSQAESQMSVNGRMVYLC